MSDGLCKPLLIKELRETLRWSPIGMIVVGLLCWQTVPDRIDLSRSLAAQFVYMAGIGAALVALAFGLLQSLGDARADARGFLLHRPISLSSIFATKLFAGFVAYVICLSPPLILTAIRLEVLGLRRLPVSVLDLLPLMIASLVIFLLHPAAMWTAYQTARWFGTRTLPLVFAGNRRHGIRDRFRCGNHTVGSASALQQPWEWTWRFACPHLWEQHRLPFRQEPDSHYRTGLGAGPLRSLHHFDGKDRRRGFATVLPS